MTSFVSNKVLKTLYLLGGEDGSETEDTDLYELFVVDSELSSAVLFLEGLIV